MDTKKTFCEFSCARDKNINTINYKKCQSKLLLSKIEQRCDI